MAPTFSLSITRILGALPCLVAIENIKKAGLCHLSDSQKVKDIFKNCIKYCLIAWYKTLKSYKKKPYILLEFKRLEMF